MLGLIYKTSYSHLKNDEKESCSNYQNYNATCRYTENISLGTHFDEKKIQSQNFGLLFGLSLAYLSLGIKYDYVIRESSI